MGVLTRHGFLFALSVLAMLAAQNSSAAVTLSATSYRMASWAMAGVNVDDLVGAILTTTVE